jgi:peptidoglycan/xylan/chitin deacetylase (PgdA/CDA1 family)
MIQKEPTFNRFRLAVYALLALLLFLSGGCATTSVSPSQETVLRTERERRSTDYVVLTAVSSDTYDSLARYYLGDEKLAYLIAEFNKNARIVPGKEVVIPLQPVNPGGLYPNGYQTVPILCYHQISPKKNSNKITVSEDTFDRQMAYLKKNGYKVLKLQQFLDFIDCRRRPPQKSVLITIDDGWKTARTIAYPILKKYGFTAVLFVYTDLIKERQNSLTLSWDDIRVLRESGVFEIGSHTVTHSDMTKIPDDQLQRELQESRQTIYAKLGIKPDVMAYPNGVFNKKVMDAMKNYGYKAGFTVIRGPNAFFHNPYSLNRTMVHNSEKLSYFTKILETFRQE